MISKWADKLSFHSLSQIKIMQNSTTTRLNPDDIVLGNYVDSDEEWNKKFSHHDKLVRSQ